MPRSKLGSGARFRALKKSIGHHGGVRNPGAVAASIGRKKYGKTAFQHMASAGRHRAAVKRHRKH